MKNYMNLKESLFGDGIRMWKTYLGLEINITIIHCVFPVQIAQKGTVMAYSIIIHNNVNLQLN